MLDVRKLKIDIHCLGDMLLTSVSPSYEYVDGKRTDTISNYRYTIVLPQYGYEKLSVKILGDQQVQSPNQAIPVDFDQLELGIYISNGRPQVYAKADAIYVLE